MGSDAQRAESASTLWPLIHMQVNQMNCQDLCFSLVKFTLQPVLFLPPLPDTTYTHAITWPLPFYTHTHVQAAILLLFHCSFSLLYQQPCPSLASTLHSFRPQYIYTCTPSSSSLTARSLSALMEQAQCYPGLQLLPAISSSLRFAMDSAHDSCVL